MKSESETEGSQHTRIGALLFAVLRSAGRLPLGWRQAIGRACGYLFGALPTRERRVAELQLKAFLPEASRSDTIRRLFASAGQTVLEGLDLQPLLALDTAAFYFAQPDVIADILRENRPILGLTAHTGNWELLAAKLKAIGVNIVAVGRPARNPLMQETLARLRQCAGIPMLWRAGRHGLREIIDAYKRGCLIGALIDQDTQVSSIAVPFFGEPAQTPVTLIELAKKYNARILVAAGVREADGRIAAHFHWLDETAPPAEILGRYHAVLEELIRKHPDQWVWFHKRWRTLPDGRRRSSAEYLRYLESRTHG